MEGSNLPIEPMTSFFYEEAKNVTDLEYLMFMSLHMCLIQKMVMLMLPFLPH